MKWKVDAWTRLYWRLWFIRWGWLVVPALVSLLVVLLVPDW